MTDEKITNVTMAVAIDSLPCGCYRREGDGKWFCMTDCPVHGRRRHHPDCACVECIGANPFHGDGTEA